MTNEEEKAIDYLEKLHPMMWWQLPDENGRLKIDIPLKNAIATVLNLIKIQQAEIDFLIQERNYIKSNLEIDLNRRNIYSQAKGQISQILEYYTSNDKQLNNILKGR